MTPPEPLFTGTDALGREWVNGRLVAAKGEAPAGGGSPSPDVTPPAPEPAPEPKDAGETRKDAAPAAGPDAEAWLARQSQAMEPTSEQVADATRTFKALRKGTYSPAAAAGQATAARDAARQALTDAYLAQQAAQQNLERAHRVFASGLMPHDAHSRAADKARRAAEAIDAAFKAYREKEAWRRAVASRHPELFAPAVPAPAPPDTPTATAPATAPPAKPLTTAQAAKHLNVAPRTVSKWAAMGKLKATREEGTNNRLIAPADLAAFMREHGFEVPAGLEGGEPPSPDVAGPRQPAAPPADAAPQPDGTRKAKDGTVWAKAPAGGAVSPVNGQSYKGGQWMPIHGLSEPKKAGKGDGLGDAPKPPDEDAEAKGKRQPRRPMSPEDVEAERGRREAQAAWDEIKAGPLGRMKWTGDSPNRKAVADERIDLKGWQEFAERIGPEGVARVAAAVEPVVHAGIGRFAADARAKQTPGNEAAFGGIPDDLERYEREQVKRRAEEDVSQGRTNKAHEKRVPGSHYARQLVQAALFNMGQPSLEVMREVNRLLAGAERGPDATPAGPDTAGGGPDTAPKPPSPGFTGKDATGHCWEDGRVVPCPDETPAGPAAAPAASSPPGVPPEADAGPDSPPPGATPSAPELPDASPREQADADALAARASAEYAFARESAVPNVGEDVGGSARHVRNQWKGLDDAEREGTAEALVTRDNLFRNEPPALLANVAPANALASLAAHLALSAFPPDPGLSYASRDPRHSPEERRRQYYEAYRAVKAAAEGAAAEEADPFKALARVNAAVAGEVRRLRQQAGEGYMAQVSAKDRYNPVANALVETLNRTRVQPSPRYYKKTDVGTRLLDFAARVKGAYGEVTPETLGRVAEHVKDVMEGDSFNKTFGTVQAGKKTFTPADLYVKHAVRKGGPVIDAATVKAGIDHLTKVQGMRAVQWGNSVTDDERQHHLARTAEAFADLTDVLGLPPDMASLGGELALAIGARGKGSAMAHYEPDVKVINLTRKNGVGSLAHEWGHFLDHLLAAGGLTGTGDKVKADFMSGQASARRFVKARPGERANAYGIRVDEHGRMATEDVSSDPVWSAMDGVRSAMRDSGFDARCRSATSDAVRDGRLPKSRYEYWNSVEERFARSFERYVQHRLHEADRENTYLSGVEPHDFWPNEDEVRAMAPAFDRLMAAAGEWFGKRQAGKPG